MAEITEPALDPMDVWLEVTQAFLAEGHDVAGPDRLAKLALEVVWRCGWRPARLTELMQETPDERVLDFDGDQ